MASKRGRESEFDARTKRRLAERVGHACSLCGGQTTAASDEHSAAVNNVGVAAHIRGARKGSRRYDAAMSPADRSSIENGIWLCQTCAKKVDGDAAHWTLPKLFEAKFTAEQRAKLRLGKRPRGRGVRFALGEFCYEERFQAAFVPVRIVNEDSRAVTIESACVIVGGVQYEASEPFCSVRFGDRELLQRPPIRLSGRDAVQGAWVFGGIKKSPFQEKIRPAIELVTKVVGRRAKRHVLVRGGDAGKFGSRSAYIPDDGSIR